MADSNTHTDILLAGAFAAFTIDLLVYPLDTIKTRMQSRDYIKTYAGSSSSSSSPSTTASALRRAVPSSAYALRGLYQGIGSVIVATLPASGIFFTTYESAKRILGNALPNVTGGAVPPAALVHSAASGIAELASCLVLTPAEVIKQNAQMLQNQTAGGGGGGSSSSSSSSRQKGAAASSSSLQAFRMLRNAKGGAGRRLLSGYTALAARNLPFTALQFPLFEAMRKRLWAAWYPTQSTTTATRTANGSASAQQLLSTGVVNGLSAGTSGAIAAVVTTPTDVVKTRMMLSASWAEEDHKRASTETQTKIANRRMGAVQLARLIYHDHGVRGLFRGGALRAAWTFVGSGLYLGTYEVAKTWLRGGRDDPGDDGGV
ncbi:mitochondrial carrier protein [Niveomyces insectorum RCEF 264]|uniref:Mitochondrial carrier protein n=1 Tax=Niveomyces insectorum RCEF 264 TaxID=1081102 RepID=A0A167XY88_9HYPO|nr:mitochondrial carrier protein [Niveomyces insectorum RCEF 264]